MMNKINQLKVSLYYELLKQDKTLTMTAGDNILLDVLFDDPAIQKMFLDEIGDAIVDDVVVGYKGVVTYDEPRIDPHVLDNPPTFLDEVVDVTDDMVVSSIPAEITNIEDSVERELTKFLWSTNERQKEIKQKLI